MTLGLASGLSRQAWMSAPEAARAAAGQKRRQHPRHADVLQGCCGPIAETSPPTSHAASSAQAHRGGAERGPPPPWPPQKDGGRGHDDDVAGDRTHGARHLPPLVLPVKVIEEPLVGRIPLGVGLCEVQRRVQGDVAAVLHGGQRSTTPDWPPWPPRGLRMAASVSLPMGMTKMKSGSISMTASRLKSFRRLLILVGKVVHAEVGQHGAGLGAGRSARGCRRRTW